MSRWTKDEGHQFTYDSKERRRSVSSLKHHNNGATLIWVASQNGHLDLIYLRDLQDDRHFEIIR